MKPRQVYSEEEIRRKWDELAFRWRDVHAVEHIRRAAREHPEFAAAFDFSDVDRAIDPSNENRKIVVPYFAFTLDRLITAAAKDPRINRCPATTSHEVLNIERIDSDEYVKAVVVTPERYRVYSSRRADPNVDMSDHNELCRGFEYIGTGNIPETLDLIAGLLS